MPPSLQLAEDPLGGHLALEVFDGALDTAVANDDFQRTTGYCFADFAVLSDLGGVARAQPLAVELEQVTKPVAVINLSSGIFHSVPALPL